MKFIQKLNLLKQQPQGPDMFNSLDQLSNAFAHACQCGPCVHRNPFPLVVLPCVSYGGCGCSH